MLKKLLKYDLKYLYKTLSLFYLIAFIFAIFTAIFKAIDGGFIFEILSFTTSFITVLMVILIVGYNLLKLWVKFLNSLFKDESYLTHTLPASKKAIFTSKFASTLITLTTSFIVVFVTLFIAFYSRDMLEFLKTSLDGLTDIYNSSALLFILLLSIIFFLEVVATVMAGYTGILLGHRCNSNKLAMSIVIGYIISMVFSLIMLALIFVAGFFIRDIMDLFLSDETPTIETIKLFLQMGFGIYIFEIVVYYIIDLHILKKGINVE